MDTNFLCKRDGGIPHCAYCHQYFARHPDTLLKRYYFVDLVTLFPVRYLPEIKRPSFGGGHEQV
jgi:hypothetical protein